MSYPIIVIGESGSGKSTSLQNLNPKSTFIIGALDKPLPFRGWRKNYTLCTKANPTGNLLYTDDYTVIDAYLSGIDKTRPEIKVAVIDDMQYLMVNSAMRRAFETGYGKWNELANQMWNLIFKARMYRPDLFVVFLSHIEMRDDGKLHAKTLGKMLDSTITIEGMFTVVLQTSVTDGQYVFLTQGNGISTAKSPAGMFPPSIPNDLNAVINAITTYEKGE